MRRKRERWVQGCVGTEEETGRRVGKGAVWFWGRPSPLNLFPHFCKHSYGADPGPPWNKCQSFPAHHPLLGGALLLLAWVAWAAHGRCQTGIDLAVLAG